MLQVGEMQWHSDYFKSGYFVKYSARSLELPNISNFQATEQRPDALVSTIPLMVTVSGVPTTIGVPTTTGLPETTTGVPETTTTVPETTTGLPDTTTGVPGTTSEVPETTTGIPETTTGVQETTTATSEDPGGSCDKDLEKKYFLSMVVLGACLGGLLTALVLILLCLCCKRSVSFEKFHSSSCFSRICGMCGGSGSTDFAAPSTNVSMRQSGVMAEGAAFRSFKDTVSRSLNIIKHHFTARRTFLC